MKKFVILFLISVLFTVTSCKKDVATPEVKAPIEEVDESYIWDSQNIRYEESDIDISEYARYKRSKGTTGIIGSFKYNTNDYFYFWSFENSTKSTANFTYQFIYPKGERTITGTYTLEKTEEGVYLIHTKRDTDSKSIYTYKYLVNNDYLYILEITG